ncbi:hypothetical protein EDE12_1034 [Methylosinus sp. sav-2]|jgi:hypothetical protein|uniref:hypothetical protein n=1 Tax=Methylosinus sp. sav-2 TaxID=2485168 RepID=UPI00047D8461|nr:hypothetical protein [Methylosinus sp. sav-2]TDX65033.1 hypothetical protein EDE12_1034 [Methylosinus sp. sav-2]
MIIDRRPPARGAGRRLLFLMRLAASAAALLFPEAAFPQAAPGFNLCVQPGSPPCVFMPGQPAEACGAEVQAYIASVFHYRECLAKESERVIRESNDIIDHWRCRERGERCRK